MAIEDIPYLIRNDVILYNLNTKLTDLRAELELAASKVLTGGFSIKKVFLELLPQVYDIIYEIRKRVETLVVPKNRADDFTNAVVTLDEFADFDVIYYYNGLNKLRLMFYGIRVALIQIRETYQRPLNPLPYDGGAEGTIGVLREEEFLEQGFDNPVTEIESNYVYYSIVQGDTLQSIAVKMYHGDVSKWPEIAAVNNISDSDLIDNDLVGTTIKIPTTGGVVGRNSENLVFESFFEGTDQKKIENYLYGRDFDMYRNVYTRKCQFLIDGQNDLKITEGVQTVIENLNDRFSHKKGELNPLHPIWGIEIPVDKKNVPYVVLLDRLLSELEYQAMDDPRVISAGIDRKSLVVTGDRLDVDQEVSLVGGTTEKQTIMVPTL